MGVMCGGDVGRGCVEVMCGGDVGRGCGEVMWGGDKCSRTSCTTDHF